MRPHFCLWKAQKVDGKWELEGLPLIIFILAIVAFMPVIWAWMVVKEGNRDPKLTRLWPMMLFGFVWMVIWCWFVFHGNKASH